MTTRITIMTIIANYCKAEIRFICKTHNQPSCVYFKQDKSIPSLACKYGLSDRKCSNEKANRQAIKFYLMVKKWEDN